MSKFTPILLLLAVLVSGCRKNQQSGWNTQLLVPIANTTLTLQNLITDTSALKTNADSSLTLSYTTSLYSFNLADQIVKIPDTSIGQKFTLDSLVLPQSSITDSITLGYMAASSPTLGAFVFSNIGNSVPIPAIPSLPSIIYPFDASLFFDSAYISSATISIDVYNNLPIPIGPGATLSLLRADSTVIVVKTIPQQIPPYGEAILNYTLTNDTITNHILFEISNLSTPGSNGVPVFIDTSDDIVIHAFLEGMHVSQAWAKFPNQGVINQTGDITVAIGDRKFSYIDARSGFLHITIYNSVPQPLYLQYTMVGAYNNRGNPLTVFTTVPAAINGVAQSIDDTINITGYSINLTGQNGSKFNTYTQRIIARIDSTGQTQHITLADSLNIKYQLINIAPNYIKGYTGRDTVLAVDSTAFSFLNIFKSGTVNLQSVNLNFNVVNGIGVPGQVKINRLTAFSSANNLSVPLTSSLLGQPLNIHSATDYPLTPAVDNFSFNNSNSNIKNLLGILPNKLNYNVQIRTNVTGNTGLYRDFAYLQSDLNINLNAEMPLSLIANHLLLVDTINFNLSNTNTNVNGITDGLINVIAENKYPIQALLTVIIYNGNWQPVDTLVLNQTINPAALNNSCRAVQPAQTVLQVNVNQSAMNRIKQGQYAVISANFSTSSNNTLCNGQHLKIYSDYSIGITLSAKFNYRVTGNL